MSPSIDIPRMTEFQSFIQEGLGNKDISIEPIAGDVSLRKYYRVHDKDKSWVLMEWDPVEDLENFPFLSIQKYLQQNNIHVPDVHHIDATKGLFLLEDLGDLTLERKFWEIYNPTNIAPYYRDAIDQICHVHRLVASESDKSSCTAYQIEFDQEKFVWEMNYTKKNLLEGLCQMQLTSEVAQSLEAEFNEISRRLIELPQVICHRDYHSRNLMLKKEKMYLIDFQDARLGPPQYDLVSLFHDSYVKTGIKTVHAYTDYYLQQMPDVLKEFSGREEFVHFFQLQTIQRCFKACGTFSYVYLKRDDHRYLRYLPRTIKKVRKALSDFNDFPTLTALMAQVKIPQETLL